MKIKQFFWNRINGLKTFPVAHLILLFLTGCSTYFIHIDQNETRQIKLIVAGILGFLVSLIWPLLTLHAEEETKTIRIINRITQFFALPTIAGYYRLLQGLSENARYAENLLYFWIFPLLILGILTLIARIFRQKEHKIWFSRTSLLHSVGFWLLAGLIVWGGLSGALGSISELFDVDINRKWYEYFWTFSMFLLAGSFMINYYSSVTEYLPKGSHSEFELQSTRLMKIFGSYIFLPLALIYLTIFTAYGIKILITGVRPKGIIVWLGTGYFARGMLTYFLTFAENSKFFDKIRQILFISFVLVALMMIKALQLRIQDYGITINRYFVGMFILFIIGFSVLALCLPKMRLRLFISLLFGLSLISLYSPRNAPTIAFSSQKSRIESLLAKANLKLPLQKDSFKDLTGDGAGELTETVIDFVNTQPYEKRNKVLFNNQYSDKDNSRSYGYEIRDYLWIEDSHREPEESKDIEFKVMIPYNFFSNKGVPINNYNKFYKISWLDPETDDESLSYTLWGERKKLDLTPYLEEIFAQSSTGRIASEGEGEPIIIDQGNYKFIITDFEGTKLENGQLRADRVIEGYLLTK